MKAQILLLLFLSHEAMRTLSRSSKPQEFKRPELKSDRRLSLFTDTTMWWNVLTFIGGLLLGIFLSFYITCRLFGVYTKKASITKLRGGSKKRLLFEAYGKTKSVLQDATSQGRRLEDIIRDEKMWQKIMKSDEIFRPSLRVANSISISSLPAKVIGRRLNLDVTRKLQRELAKAVEDPTLECVGQYCYRYFLNALGIGIVIGLISALIYNSYLDELLLDETKKKSKGGRKLKVGLMLTGPLASVFRKLYTYSAKVEKSNALPTTPVKTILRFIASRSLAQKKEIAQSLKKVVNLLPPNIKSLFLPNKII